MSILNKKSTASSKQNHVMGQIDVASFSEQQFDQFDKMVGEQKLPVIAKGKALNWSATKKWTPQFFKQSFGKLKVNVSTKLPTDQSPYFSTEKQHRTKILVEDFVDNFMGQQSCYLDQADISLFDGLGADFHFEECFSEEPKFTSLWIGNKTRSGLHYDNMDNMYVQIHGTKNVLLVGPSDSGSVYPFADNVSKSKVDPENPDLSKYPKFASVTLYQACLEPGDVLFFPKGWWHHFVSPESSISLSCWYGDFLTISEQVKGVNAAGYHLWLTIIRDFVWLGALGRPFKQRLFSSPPTGKILFDAFFPSKSNINQEK